MSRLTALSVRPLGVVPPSPKKPEAFCTLSVSTLLLKDWPVEGLTNASLESKPSVRVPSTDTLPSRFTPPAKLTAGIFWK